MINIYLLPNIGEQKQKGAEGGGTEGAPPQKSKAELKRERRAKQVRYHLDRFSKSLTADSKHGPIIYLPTGPFFPGRDCPCFF